MLGISIGIAAVILTVGLGQGAQQQVRGQINSARQQPAGRLARQLHHAAASAAGVGTATTLTDGRRRGARRPGRRAGHRRRGPGQHDVRSRCTAGSTNWTTTVVGTTPDWLTRPGPQPSAGPVLHRRTSWTRRPRRGARRRPPPRSCSAVEPAVGQTVTVERHARSPSSACWHRPDRRVRPTRTTRRSCPTPPAQLAVGTVTAGSVVVDLPRRPARRTGCRRPTRRRRGCC